MKQQSYKPLRFVYLLMALLTAMLLIARPVMADEEDKDPWRLGYNQGLTKGKEDGKVAEWTDLTPPDPEVPKSPKDIDDSNHEHYRDGYKDGYKEGYNEGFGGSYPLLLPVKFIWGIILHWWEKLI
ncbi:MULTISPECIES: hypothetical protein [Streptococcus]|uniref:Uncharacterized protein n=1 Tax=Streptococcus dysgalactiae subsp. equisimilis AC-2713 TaxID=759913 RepID=A0AB33RB30_STREQ|nr:MULTISPECIES: hypothetical protein [Streptococcus]KKC17363.1 hypothetical protein WH14_08695 [Streptococcus dysgalactiae subsp. equisimilis]QJD62692.1 hypothetical protein HG697_09630 [Streptococcus dysgalactiae subsp. equisimilis]QJD64639.1 hypothetical protein HHM65_09870 [Streptococcus dysgalactiae subsp. equisimilis]QQC50039.1 hypothetical protein I6H74_02405 [Streptococcus dysgalactiae]CCI63603.1 hypothetical protein SDSE_2122 [Streptococcus dysgalactiae subsp. equisimilis AC-2713]